jgi:hypothetical protein
MYFFHFVIFATLRIFAFFISAREKVNKKIAQKYVNYLLSIVYDFWLFFLILFDFIKFATILIYLPFKENKLNTAPTKIINYSVFIF